MATYFSAQRGGSCTGKISAHNRLFIEVANQMTSLKRREETLIWRSSVIISHLDGCTYMIYGPGEQTPFVDGACVVCTNAEMTCIPVNTSNFDLTPQVSPKPHARKSSKVATAVPLLAYYRRIIFTRVYFSANSESCFRSHH